VTGFDASGDEVFGADYHVVVVVKFSCKKVVLVSTRFIIIIVF